MSIGIIGAGAQGASIARMLAKSGIAATLANRRGPASLAGLVEELGPTIAAGTVAEAAAKDLVIVAVRWAALGEALGGLPAWNGRIVVDATNPVSFLDADSPERQDESNPLAAFGIKIIDLGGRPSSQVFRDHVPGARVVRAFNHISAEDLQSPDTEGGKRVLFFSGDDAAAKAQVRRLVEAAGFAPVDLGPLDIGAPLVALPVGPLAAGRFVMA
ncbi:NADPH-dependent F420 reductase [Phenylobacterium sp.]|uniref:NADPH-dependent F420 reductase n=1 Tax=Phenylobacterium sp. TaxID=1871053 RepID=UPI002BAEA00D|nr:NAD(P)-binding domain-containing protein [Phenylobacterium sp.]HLZ74779.1 NAD(P)-binding domain-containing protein [Phenylobacterium sp.]